MLVVLKMSIFAGRKLNARHCGELAKQCAAQSETVLTLEILPNVNRPDEAPRVSPIGGLKLCTAPPTHTVVVLTVVLDNEVDVDQELVVDDEDDTEVAVVPVLVTVVVVLVPVVTLLVEMVVVVEVVVLDVSVHDVTVELEVVVSRHPASMRV